MTGFVTPTFLVYVLHLILFSILLHILFVFDTYHHLFLFLLTKVRLY
ncbi:hypothetical protein CoNPh2_CDS0142 [Staphylococcus phage S-CoN_Ph2]|nr:hypothetical protein CoNPh2_CDS0142 [Staphylococcus phage S-CoN_Ph2]WNM51895.1 hypothetical protein CoNPh4_CDS0019 [Staphylococcus phage S-CoN_Ph4]WNM52078.1 hypothetical protein CoNPh5_CDS0032 [Staphylococcus phage S-CoN_Ph5]WNM52534.1 hypothetical protein CoNPh7_CDS0162 [Staphylococcus phage S-CoN_Ph7]WNM52575.1 hypothetical protein CoNPh8_CDS0021 [Staphylococcus phage S-CoN_Ph8]WNM53436.1 hypothetical protein CoNPh12_CDS0149 [Staphylococcus phage S-CoN_Ph12]WNM53659.1 hypothetical prote